MMPTFADLVVIIKLLDVVQLTACGALGPHVVGDLLTIITFSFGVKCLGVRRKNSFISSSRVVRLRYYTTTQLFYTFVWR